MSASWCVEVIIKPRGEWIQEDLPGATCSAPLGSASYHLELPSSDFGVGIATPAGTNSGQFMASMGEKAAQRPLFARTSASRRPDTSQTTPRGVWGREALDVIPRRGLATHRHAARRRG